jgi:hypothetical protein
MPLESVFVGDVNISRPKLVSGARMLVFATAFINNSEGPRCLPAEIGSALPRNNFKAPIHREHPTEMSSTVDSGLRAKEPVNGSSLVTECLPEPSPDRE